MALPLVQVALSVHDLDRTSRWYEDVFGFLPSGRRSHGGEQIARVQGLPVSEFELAWLVDAKDFFQLELFQFRAPEPRPRPDGWTRADVGYASFAIYVRDFEQTLARLGVTGSGRVTVADPDGTLVEVLENDPVGGEWLRPEVPSVVRGVSVSVRDLDRARRFWVDTLGLEPAGGGGRSVVLAAGGATIELVEHPGGRDWPDGYRISDYGIVNIALGGPDEDGWHETIARTKAAGYHHNEEIHSGDVDAVYLDDDQGFSVELLRRRSETRHMGGFDPV